MDKNYLKFFCLCFKCLEFFYKKKYKKTVLMTSILILLTEADNITSNFLKAVFHKIYLVHT